MTMIARCALGLVLLFAAPATAAAPSRAAAPARVGYADMARIFSKATEPARLMGALRAEKDERQRVLDEAVAAAEHAGARPEAKGLREKAGNIFQANQAFIDERQRTVSEHLRKKLGEICDELRAERNLGEVLPVLPLSASPSPFDLTDEIIKRWDKADVEALAAENDRLKAENATLKEKKGEAKAPPAAEKK